MNDIVEFQKLFKVNFPVVEHHQYYTDTMMKSEFYAGLGNVIRDFELFEQDVEDEGIYSSARSYKLDYALPNLKNYIINTEAYKSMMSADFDSSKLRKKDELRKNDDTYLMSIDFKAANYNALKTFDTKDELYGSWEELCIALDIHVTLAKSKSFRQYVFGNTSPKRLGKIQHRNIITLVDKLIENHGFEEDDFVFISHDELVVRLRPDHKHAIGRIHVLNAAVGTILQNEGITMPTHYKVFKNEPIQNNGKNLKSMCVQTQYNVKMGGFSEKSESLFKVPGNKFFKYFKTHVLKEELDRRDLMFISDGEIAVWSKDEDSIAERITPEGELSFIELEEQYPDLVKKLKKEVTGLNEPQIRKIGNIALEFNYKGY